MDLDFLYTDSNYNELGYFTKCEIDVEIGRYGQSSNDFELTLSSLNLDFNLDEGSLFYAVDTEWGGIIQSKKVDTSSNKLTFKGKTWRGLLEKEYIQPPNGQAYYVASGEANSFIQNVISKRFDDLFVVDNVGLSDITVDYQIRDINLLKALEKTLYKADIPSRLDIKYYDRKVHLQAIPIVDLSELLQYDNSYGLSMIAETPTKGYNHIIALGKGELTDRLRVNLYLKKDGTWTTSSNTVYKGFARKTYIYEDVNCEDVNELTDNAINKVMEENGTSTLSISFSSDDSELFDIVGAKEEITGLSFKEQITQKILKASFNNDIKKIEIQHKVGD